MPNRLSGKCLALWVSADDSTPPIDTDVVLYLTGLNPSMSRPATDVTAACDAFASNVAGIPSGTVAIQGWLDKSSFQLFGEFITGGNHLMHLLPDANVEDDFLSFIGFFSEWATSAAVDGAWDLSATVTMVSEPQEVNGP